GRGEDVLPVYRDAHLEERAQQREVRGLAPGAVRRGHGHREVVDLGGGFRPAPRAGQRFSDAPPYAWTAARSEGAPPCGVVRSRFTRGGPGRAQGAGSAVLAA